MKKIFVKIVSGSLSVDTRRVSTENAPEGDSKEIFKESGETFEIASNVKIGEEMRLFPYLLPESVYTVRFFPYSRQIRAYPLRKGSLIFV